MNAYLHNLLPFLLFICPNMPAMNVTNKSSLNSNSYIPILTDDGKHTFIQKKLLDECEYFRNLLDYFKDMHSIYLPNDSTAYPINHAILKQLLVPCLHYVHVINHKKTSAMFKKSTIKALNNFLKERTNTSLHTLINNTNYFAVPVLLKYALKHWAWRSTTQNALHTFRSNPNNALSNNYYFPPDLQKEITAHIMKPLLHYMINDHLSNDPISHTKLLKRIHSNSFMCAKFHPNGKLIASGSYDKNIYLGKPNDGFCTGILNGHRAAVYALKFAHINTTLLASGDKDGIVCLWDINTQKNIKTFIGHRRAIQNIRFSPNEKLLASCSEDKTIRIWDIQSGTCTHILHGHTDCIRKLYFKNDDILYSASIDNTIRIWNLKNNKEVKQFGPSYGELTIHNNIIATDNDNNYDIHLINGTTHKIIATLSGHTNHIFDLVISPDGKLLASASYDTTIKIWDMQTKKCLRTLHHENTANSICFSPDGKLLLSTSADKTTRVWNIFPKKTYKALTYLRTKTTQEQALLICLAYQAKKANRILSLNQRHLQRIYNQFPSAVQNFLRKRFAIYVPNIRRKRYIYDHFGIPPAKRIKKT